MKLSPAPLMRMPRCYHMGCLGLVAVFVVLCVNMVMISAMLVLWIVQLLILFGYGMCKGGWLLGAGIAELQSEVAYSTDPDDTLVRAIGRRLWTGPHGGPPTPWSNAGRRDEYSPCSQCPTFRASVNYDIGIEQVRTHMRDVHNVGKHTSGRR